MSTKVKIIDTGKIKSANGNVFVNTVYNNFIHLQGVQNLSHTKDDIRKVLNSENPQLYVILINGKIASYLLGEIVNLNDGRIVLYVTYIFTAKKFRALGHATKLLKVADEIAKKNNLDGVMLTCDSENDYVYNFYLKRGFMPDMLLRQYSKYEVMFKY